MADKIKKCVLTNVVEEELSILERHVRILKKLINQQPMGIIKLSEETGFPQHMVRYSLHVLEKEGLVEPSPRGAVTAENLDDAVTRLLEKLKKINKISGELITELQNSS